MKASLALILFCTLSVSALGADGDPWLKTAPMPFYPSLAAQARIAGKVVLHYSIEKDGTTVDVEVLSGRPMLRGAAVENVKSWKFDAPECGCRVQREAVFDYILAEKKQLATSIVKWYGKTGAIRVQVEVQAPAINTSSPH